MDAQKCTNTTEKRQTDIVKRTRINCKACNQVNSKIEIRTREQRGSVKKPTNEIERRTEKQKIQGNPTNSSQNLGKKMTLSEATPGKGRVKNLVEKLNRSVHDDSSCKTSQYLLRQPSTTKMENSIRLTKKLETKIANNKNLPVKQKERNDDNDENIDKDSKILNSWTKVVGVDVLYTLLSKKHLTLQRAYHVLQKRLAREEEERMKINQKRKEIYDGNNKINANENENDGKTRDRIREMLTEIADLREQNELLEFRLLELEDCNQLNIKCDKQLDEIDNDDVSDSGVMSLSPIEEYFHDSDLQESRFEEGVRLNANEIKDKLERISMNDKSSETNATIHQAIQLIKYYDNRVNKLENTINTMCQERVRNNNVEDIVRSDYNVKTPRIVATVPPFTNGQSNGYDSDISIDEPVFKRIMMRGDVDSCLQESGIFDEFSDYNFDNNNNNNNASRSQETQTDFELLLFEDTTTTERDLTIEINKLNKIKEKIEELELSTKRETNTNNHNNNNNNKEKELAFYKDQYEILTHKLEIYETSTDTQLKHLTNKVKKELVLQTQIKKLNEYIQQLKNEKSKLEEEKCEFEEAENDTRFKCQKLEMKLLATVEKKNDLQFQVQECARTVTNLRNKIIEYETRKKLIENCENCYKLELMTSEYEERIFELEEREMEAKYRLQMLELLIPILIAWNVFLITNSTTTSITNYENNGEKERKEENKKEENIRENEKKRKEIEKEGKNEEKQQKIEEKQQKIEENPQKRIEKDFREKLYEETLNNADEILTAMENDYKEKLTELQNKLNNKQYKLEECERKLKQLAIKDETENQLIDRIQNNEQEIKELKKIINVKEEEKIKWIRKEESLMKELEIITSELTKLKLNQNELKMKLDVEKNLTKEQSEEISQKEKDFSNLEFVHSNKMKQINSQIRKLEKDIENHEVTNGELKEEVETLETVVCELKKSLIREKDEKEKLQIELSEQVSKKEREIEMLMRLTQDVTATNAAEEIQYHECQNAKYNNTRDKSLFHEVNSVNQITSLNDILGNDKCMETKLNWNELKEAINSTPENINTNDNTNLLTKMKIFQPNNNNDVNTTTLKRSAIYFK